jgi:hypothetical protein
VDEFSQQNSARLEVEPKPMKNPCTAFAAWSDEETKANKTTWLVHGLTVSLRRFSTTIRSSERCFASENCPMRLIVRLPFSLLPRIRPQRLW